MKEISIEEFDDLVRTGQIKDAMIEDASKMVLYKNEYVVIGTLPSGEQVTSIKKPIVKVRVGTLLQGDKFRRDGSPAVWVRMSGKFAIRENEIGTGATGWPIDLDELIRPVTFVCANCSLTRNINERGFANPDLCKTCIDADNKREYELTFGKK